MASFVSLWISGVTFVCFFLEFAIVFILIAVTFRCLNLLDCAADCCSATLQNLQVKSLTALVSYLLSHKLWFSASVCQDDTRFRFQTACMHPWSRNWSFIASQSYRTHKKFKTKAEWRWESVGVSWCLDTKAETHSRCSLSLLSYPQHWSL